MIAPTTRAGAASAPATLVLALGLTLTTSAAAQGTLTTTTATTTPPEARLLEAPATTRVLDESMDLPLRYDPYDPRADRTGTPIGPPRTSTVPPASAEPGVRRPVPDYDGREPAPGGARDVLIWVPRVVLYPAYLVMEYGVRWPLIQFITWQEREKILANIGRFFTFREGRSGLFPTAFFDFGLSPSVGFFFFNDDLFVDGHSLQVQGGFWEDDWRRIVLRDRLEILEGTGDVRLRVEYATRPDHPYYGSGYATNQNALTYFEHRVLDVELGLGAVLGDLNRISGYARYRNAELVPSRRQPSVDTRFDVDRLGFFDGRGYQLLTGGLLLELDTRKVDRAFTDGTGLRLELSADGNVNPDDTDLNFIRWSVQGNAFYDVTGHNHVLGVQVYTSFVERTGARDVPISELVSGGGGEVLRGFLGGRFRGDSMFAATLNYRYPVWILVDADLFLGVGNAFGPNLEGFVWKRLVLSGGFALRTNISRETSLDLLVGFGTNRFEEDLRIDSVRFTFGANHGF